MDAHSWNPGQFGQVLSQICDAADLSQADIVRLSGAAQSTVSRWTKSASQPRYEAIKQLADSLTRSYPRLGDLPAQLITTAGYGAPVVVEAPERALPDVAVLQEEIDRLMAGLPPERRRRIERIIAEEEAELDRMRRERLRRWQEMVRLASPDPD